MKYLLNLIALIVCIPGCKTTSLEPIYDTYPQLGFDIIESTSYELIKVADWDGSNQHSAVNSITQNNTILIDTGNLMHTLLDGNGNLISSYTRGKGERLINGVYFAKDYYVDWPLTGDKTKKNYSEYIHRSTLSKSEFNHFIERAEQILYTILPQYEPEKNFARCLLKIDGNWILIETELPESIGWLGSAEMRSQKVFNHTNTLNNEEVFLEIKNEIIPFYNWTDSTNAIHLKNHYRREKSYLRFSSDQAEAGWNSTGYFTLNFGDEKLAFKAFSFEWKRLDTFNTDMSLYYYKKSELAILVVSMNMGNDMWQVDKNPKEAGIYVIRKKRSNDET